MDYDPLSPPTRRARRALIAVSSVAILAKLFCARIEQLPVGGVGLNINAGFLDWALIGALLYLSGLSIYYLKIDWTNRGQTPAELAESTARQAVLVEIDREVKAAATEAALRYNARANNPTVVEDIVAVFWRFKSNPSIEREKLHEALATTTIHEEAHGELAEVMRAGWKIVAARTESERRRAIASKQDELKRFWLLEAALPMAIAILALLAFASPDGFRDKLSLSSCEAPAQTGSQFWWSG